MKYANRDQNAVIYWSSDFQTILDKIHSNICLQTMVIVQIHKIVIEKRHPPCPPGPMLVWKVKCKLDLVQMIINIDLGEGVDFNLQK